MLLVYCIPQQRPTGWSKAGQSKGTFSSCMLLTAQFEVSHTQRRKYLETTPAPFAAEGQARAPPHTSGRGSEVPLRPPVPGRPIALRRLPGTAAAAGPHLLGQLGQDRPALRRPLPAPAKPSPPRTGATRQGGGHGPGPPAACPAQSTASRQAQTTAHLPARSQLPDDPRPPPSSPAAPRSATPLRTHVPPVTAAGRQPQAASLAAPRKLKPEPALPVGGGAARHTQDGGEERPPSPRPHRRDGGNAGPGLQLAYAQHGAAGPATPVTWRAERGARPQRRQARAAMAAPAQPRVCRGGEHGGGTDTAPCVPGGGVGLCSS